MADQPPRNGRAPTAPKAARQRWRKDGTPIFDGALAQPIVYPRGALSLYSSLPRDGETAEEAQARWEKEQTTFITGEKLQKLFDLLLWYGLETNPPDWFGLAVMLANGFVGGFKVSLHYKRRRGRPRKARGAVDLPENLYHVVNDLRQRNKRLSIPAACATLTKQKGPWHGKNSASLETRYYETKRERERWTRRLRKME